MNKNIGRILNDVKRKALSIRRCVAILRDDLSAVVKSDFDHLLLSNNIQPMLWKELEMYIAPLSATGNAVLLHHIRTWRIAIFKEYGLPDRLGACLHDGTRRCILLPCVSQQECGREYDFDRLISVCHELIHLARIDKGAVTPYCQLTASMKEFLTEELVANYGSHELAYLLQGENNVFPAPREYCDLYKRNYGVQMTETEVIAAAKVGQIVAQDIFQSAVESLRPTSVAAIDPHCKLRIADLCHIG